MNSYLFCQNCQSSSKIKDFEDKFLESGCTQQSESFFESNISKAKTTNQRCSSCANNLAQIICQNCSSRYLCTQCSQKLHCKGKFTFHSVKNITKTNNIGSKKKQETYKSYIVNRKMMFSNFSRQKSPLSSVRNQSVVSEQLKLRELRQILTFKKQILETQQKQATSSWEQLIYTFQSKFNNLKAAIQEKQQKLIESLQNKKNADIQLFQVQKQKANNLIHYIDNSINPVNINQLSFQEIKFDKIQSQFLFFQDNYRGPKIFQYSFSTKQITQIASSVEQLTLKRQTFQDKSPDMKSIVKKSKIFCSSISPKHRHTNSVVTSTSEINEFQEISSIELNKHNFQLSKQEQKLKLIVLKKGSYGQNIDRQKQGKVHIMKNQKKK